jgi:hypothetical protein
MGWLKGIYGIAKFSKLTEFFNGIWDGINAINRIEDRLNFDRRNMKDMRFPSS